MRSEVTPARGEQSVPLLRRAVGRVMGLQVRHRTMRLVVLASPVDETLNGPPFSLLRLLRYAALLRVLL